MTSYLYCLSVLLFGLIGATNSVLLPDVRPASNQRTFTSKVIDDLINTLQPLFKDPNLGILLSNCLPNTLDTTVFYHSAEEVDSFVITGDITAMWLRDSANQVLPYVPYAPQDSDLQSLLEGIIARHAKSVLINPFANAFNFNASNDGHQDDQCVPPMSPSVYEEKYEIDSPSAFLKLSYWHFYYSGDDALTRFGTDTWLSAVEKVIETLLTMQADSGQAVNPPYKFKRNTNEAMDTLVEKGRGPPCKPSKGFSRSLFRPSDDATVLPYNIPGNAMACVELEHLQILLKRLQTLQPSLADRISVDLQRAADLANGICGALTTTIQEMDATLMQLPYEVDGFGSFYYMDDANIPSLLSLPVLGYMGLTNPVYQRTRDYVWSASNPYFFSGPAGAGVGG